MVVLSLAFFTLLLSQCSSDKKTLIVGGKHVSDIGQFAHALFILFSCPGQTGTWLCGGSILTQNLFLTAGHCLNIQCKLQIEAVAGSENIELDKSIIRVIDKHYRHEYFDDRGVSLRNDIALLGTKVPLPLGRNVKRVVLHKRYPEKVKMVAVAGWGRTSEKSTDFAKNLKSVWQFLETNKYCQKRLGESMWPGQMCAKNDHKNYPTIHDSGCGLISKTGQQLGLVSYRILSRPEVVIYTNVSHFYPWIKKYSRTVTCQLAKMRDKNPDDYYGEDPNVKPGKN